MNNKSFPAPLLLKDLGTVNGTQVFELLEDFRFISKVHGELVARKGFQTNGISSPRWIWPLIGPTSKAFKISVIHDMLFAKDCVYNLTRKEADRVMLEGCEALGLPWWERQAIHKALVLFSWFCWRKK
jgi:hypothetical protein